MKNKKALLFAAFALTLSNSQRASLTTDTPLNLKKATKIPVVSKTTVTAVDIK